MLSRLKNSCNADTCKPREFRFKSWVNTVFEGLGDPKGMGVELTVGDGDNDEIGDGNGNGDGDADRDDDAMGFTTG